jgi:hypothetical protein
MRLLAGPVGLRFQLGLRDAHCIRVWGGERSQPVDLRIPEKRAVSRSGIASDRAQAPAPPALMTRTAFASGPPIEPSKRLGSGLREKPAPDSLSRWLVARWGGEAVGAAITRKQH